MNGGRLQEQERGGGSKREFENIGKRKGNGGAGMDRKEDDEW